MGIREHLSGYDVPLQEFRARSAKKNEDYFCNPAKYYVKPFQILGDLYYVGDARCCVHLLDTHDGLILFDSGMQHTVHLLVQAIWELGFNPKDVRCIIHSHGHYDHFGAANDFKALYGCKNYLSAADAVSLRKNPERALLAYNPNPWANIFTPDEELQDGDHIRIGDKDIRCVLVPSHTPGTMAFFFDLQDCGKTYHVGYYGGVGFLSIYKDFLEQYHLPYTLQDEYLSSIEKVYEEEVDIVLGNHPSQNSTLEKRQLLLDKPEGPNPFIDPYEWKDFLDVIRKELKVFIQKGY